MEQDTSTGLCYASVNVYIHSDNNSLYAYGEFENYQAGWSCIGWLERSTDSGQHWYTVSGYHTVASKSGEWVVDSTGDYYDGGDYRARACFKFSFSGAAVHCTLGN